MYKNLPLYILVIIIIGLAFYFRVFPAYDIVFPEGGGVYLLGIDPYFYLRHVEVTYHNFPLLQKFDHATHYPGGLNSDATGLYTFAMAGICRLIYGAGATSDEIASVISWIPPFVTLVIFSAIFIIGVRIRNHIAGLFAILVLLLYPGLLLPRSLLGFPDHHVIEVLLSVLTILGLTEGFNNIKNNVVTNYRAILYAIPFVVFFFVWQGAPLYIIIVGLVFINFIILYKGTKEQLYKLGNFAGIYFTSAAIIYFFAQIFFPDILTSAFTKYNNFIAPILLVMGVGLFGACRIKTFIFQQGSQPWKIIFLLIFEIAGIWVFLDFTSVGKEVFQLLNFRDPSILENKPVTWMNFMDMVSIPGFLALVSAGWFFLKSIFYSTKNPQILPSVVFGIFFTFFWLNTFDMGYMLAPVISILTGVLLYDLLFISITFKSKYKLVVAAFKLVPVVILLFTILKPFLFHSKTYPFVYTSQQVSSTVLYTDAWKEGMDWLSENSPDLTYPTDEIIDKENYNSTNEGQYGVLTSWDFGNIVNQRGKRVPIWSRWPGPKASKALFEYRDSFQIEDLCSNCTNHQSVKYVIVDSRTANEFFPTKYNASIGNFNSCFSKDTLIFNQQNFVMSTYGECYESSLLYSLYRGENVDSTFFQLEWESSQLSLSGYMSQNNSVSARSFPANQMDQNFVEAIKSRGAAFLNDGLFYNGYVGPELKIYKVLSENISR